MVGIRFGLLLSLPFTLWSLARKYPSSHILFTHLHPIAVLSTYFLSLPPVSFLSSDLPALLFLYSYFHLASLLPFYFEAVAFLPLAILNLLGCIYLSLYSQH